MPTYPYACPKGHEFDVIKPLRLIEAEEKCDDCGEVAERRIGLVALDRASASDWNNPHFSPALGQNVKGHKEAQKIAKAKGMIEIGNEPVEKVHKHFDRQREETRQQRWRDADRVRLYD